MIGTLTILVGIAFCASTIGVFNSIKTGNQPMLYVNFIMWIFLFAILIFLVRYMLSLISTIKQATYIQEEIKNLNKELFSRLKKAEIRNPNSDNIFFKAS